MPSTSIEELARFGQSAWIDNISRSMIENGRLKRMIDMGLRGMTSNPSIFDKSISNSSDYDDMIKELHRKGYSPFQIYDELSIRDIQDAADIFRQVYDDTNGIDGYVSLEIDPRLAFDAGATIDEGKRLHAKINRENVMLKVPATAEGYHAVEELTSLGYNVNVTLIFSQEQHMMTAEAYVKGLERLVQGGGRPETVHSVASIFVSRIDSAVDGILDKLSSIEDDIAEKARIDALKGRAAVANCSLIYNRFLNIFGDGNLLNPQRVLWASTSTKNPAYSDIKYVSELIAGRTVNTMPDNTFDAFLDHGTVKEALTSDKTGAEDVLRNLISLEIDIHEVCARLLKDGVNAFETSFQSLLNSINIKSLS